MDTKLQPYLKDMEMVYKERKMHKNANALSKIKEKQK